MRTAAVIVSFNPDTEFADRVKAIARECDAVFIIDNGSSAESLRPLKKLKAKIILLGENTGIAHAQNVGLRLAFKNKADGVILFDHDSEPQGGFTSALWAAYEGQPAPAIMGAQVFDIHTKRFAKYPVYFGPFFRRLPCPPQEILADAMLAIASGTLISRSVFERVGDMREEFFIDYVDWDYSLRARRIFGIQTCICGAAVLKHARGERTGRKFLGVTIRPPGYSLFRYQHMYRNRAVLFRENFFRLPSFISFEILATLRDTLLICFEKRALQKLSSAIIHWFKGFLVCGKK